MTKRLKKKLNTQDTSVNHRSLEAVDTLPTAKMRNRIIHGKIVQKQLPRSFTLGIDTKVRSTGFGTALYSNLIKQLGQNSFTCIDAYIDKDNFRSVNMHKRAG